MAFVLIKGTFRPDLGTPDGDSVRFGAANNRLWSRLEGKPAKVSTSGPTTGTVQLRLEGIDAIEKAATQPLATEARDSLFRLIGSRSGGAAPGYILARMTDDDSGRPIAFAFPGAPDERDGASVFLTARRLRQSANLRQMAAGHAYPLYYNTLFAELRRTLDEARQQAKRARRGVWGSDRTTTGVTVGRSGDLSQIPPIWPKLWRRLETFLRSHTGLRGFGDFLAQDNERIDVLDVMEERGLQDLVAVTGNTVRLLEPPENLRVVGKAGQRRR